MKKSIFFFLFGFATVASFAQNVNIPDVNFKSYLVGNPNINTNSDTEIQVSEAASFTGIINVFGSNISDLTGIESFTALTQLNCTDNNLTSLNVSNNTMLTFLSCGQNNLTALDVSNNPNLTTLILTMNSITSLDVSNNVALNLLWCHTNQLSSIDVSMLTQLSDLQCNNNNISTLDVSGLTMLNKLGCFGNNLTTLDVSGNAALNSLNCALNSLTELNVANGNNTSFILFNATNNPNLTCIQVDDSTYSAINWTNIDVTAGFSENCGVFNTISESKFTELKIYPNPATDNLTISCDGQLISVFIYDMTGKLVQQELQKQFSIEELESGIYTILVKTAGGVFKDKLVKN